MSEYPRVVLKALLELYVNVSDIYFYFALRKFRLASPSYIYLTTYIHRLYR